MRELEIYQKLRTWLKNNNYTRTQIESATVEQVKVALRMSDVQWHAQRKHLRAIKEKLAQESDERVKRTQVQAIFNRLTPQQKARLQALEEPELYSLIQGL